MTSLACDVAAALAASQGMHTQTQRCREQHGHSPSPPHQQLVALAVLLDVDEVLRVVDVLRQGRELVVHHVDLRARSLV